jgi:hypothetical protein
MDYTNNTPSDLSLTECLTETSSADIIVPKYVFIVPYRDREPHRVFFSTYIYKVMEDIPRDDWTFYFVHQNDTRPFNRGGMKNIGFLALKKAFPNHYKDIIFIFNDVDTLPYDKNVINYHTEYGVVKHFYGFHFALGGIFSIRGVDFERINGFPNYWAWGGEDNLIHERAKQFGLTIDRSNFFTIGNMNILQFADGMKRLICRDELATSIMPNNSDGLSKLTNITHSIYYDTHMIDVTSFDTYIHYSQLNFEEQSLDKVNKIRVSPLNAVRNIKQLQSEYIIDANKQIRSIKSIPSVPSVNHLSLINQQPAHANIMRKINGGVNTVNVPIQANVPFMQTRNMMMNQTTRRHGIGLTMPQDRNIIKNEDREKLISNEIEKTASSGQPIQQRVYQNFKQHADIMIPLQRPNTATHSGIHNQRQFGMRALFM